MEDIINNILQNLKVPTNEVKAEVFQQVISMVHKSSQMVSSENNVNWIPALEVLWVHLTNSLKKFDDQLLCASCFYTVLSTTNNQNCYLIEIQSLIDKALISKKQHSNDPDTYKVVSLIYGMFQSNFLKKISRTNSIVNAIVLKSFDLLILMGYEYSKYTFIVFKIIILFKKVCGSELQDVIFNEINQLVLLNLVNHNWENPINGIRDLNLSVFKMLISTFDCIWITRITNEINEFYWNKAKYLMISVLIENSTHDIKTVLNNCDWVAGLVSSLDKPGLVSAGADMYCAILNQVYSDSDWCHIFLDFIIKLLKSNKYKSIENFTNYWLLRTLKKFPELVSVIRNEIVNSDGLENIFSVLCIMKQANKRGWLVKKWDSSDQVQDPIMKYIANGLIYYQAHIRMSAFEILCISHEKSLPTAEEYEHILTFIKDNINSDNTVLRISVVNSLMSFLTKLQISFATKCISDESIDSMNLLQFCTKFQEIIIFCLKLDGNYQRKIAAVKISNVFVKCLDGKSTKKIQQKHTSSKTILNYLKEKDCWLLYNENFIFCLLKLLKDPADDIRENTIDLICSHFKRSVNKTDILNNLLNEALELISSKFFYNINCAQSIIKLIIHIINQEEISEFRFKRIDDIFNYGYQELNTRCLSQDNIVKSIENGKQLYSSIYILQAVIEVSLQNQYKINTSDESLIQILNHLEEISSHFAWEQDDGCSSDFAKMNEMIIQIIDSSDHNSENIEDSTKLSGLQLNVLNCIWLNVKSSCELAALLIRYCSDSNDISITNKCLYIITKVLETSRHKGAIESAGVALGQSIQYLTSLPEHNEMSKLPFTLLTCKLNELISEANKMASVTRRGAGLSIMVHRIVSNDMKSGKPLFHYFMKVILEICNTKPNVPHDDGPNVNKEKDLPQALYIHFLTRVVNDSSLASDTMFYSGKLAELALENLSCSHWQIRNAALQLYGALIPKLIGQKKDAGLTENTTETVATVACDEFRTHSPMLWDYIETQLQYNHNENVDKLLWHSNLVPTLNIIASLAKRYNFSFDNQEARKQKDSKLLSNFMILLGSSIHTVRRLTANCIFNIFNLDDIYEIVTKNDQLSENQIHGNLLLLLHYKPSSYFNNLIKFRTLEQKLRTMLYTQKHSFICKEIFEEIFNDNDHDLQIITKFTEIPIKALNQGSFHRLRKALERYILNCSWEQIPKLFKSIVNRIDIEICIEFLLVKLERNLLVTKDILSELVTILFTYDEKYNSSLFWHVMYIVSFKVDLTNHVDVPFICDCIINTSVPHKLRYMIPFMARISAKSNENLLLISNIILTLSDPDRTTDVDMRFIAATANNDISERLFEYEDTVKINIITSAVLLLQDEDEEVRNNSVRFYTNFNRYFMVQPYVCLQKVINYSFLEFLFKYDNSIQTFLNNLRDIIDKYSKRPIYDTDNPFANNVKNIYLEVGKVRELTDLLEEQIIK